MLSSYILNFKVLKFDYGMYLLSSPNQRSITNRIIHVLVTYPDPTYVTAEGWITSVLCSERSGDVCGVWVQDYVACFKRPSRTKITQQSKYRFNLRTINSCNCLDHKCYGALVATHMT